MENSRIMRTLHYFTDVYGPRLTGSPNLKAAGEWAVKEMAEWGFEHGHLEPWVFGHPGWANERLTAHFVSPIKEPLTCEALAWTPGTKGTVTARVVQLSPPTTPTQEELTAYLDKMKDKISDKIVMVGIPSVIAVNLDPPAKRMDDKAAKARFSGNDPNTPPLAGAQQQQGQQQNQQQNQGQGQPPKLRAAQVNEQVDAFLLANRALLRVNDGSREHRQIRAFNNNSFDLSKVVPTVILSNEDFGRIIRILADGTPVELEFNIVNSIFPEGRTAYNVISEIPGTDKKDEVIMLGGHLDSWHAATGATDNAIGCAVMMEAARILRSIGVKPRRTIRVALWSGEEQGLLGSRAYIKEHFGTFEEPKPDYFKFGGYFNIDSGTGRARGMGVFGPPEAAQPLRQALTQFDDFGFFGAVATRSRRLGGSDHTSFNNAGLPGIGVSQDPIEYFSATWHTNLDTYERIIEGDAKKSAIVIAAAVYYLAMREDLLPRISKEQMPPLPPSRQ
ncbi:MAG: M20/M25/M40 family metallo-hydrolase [Acidobacteria bacterium]|nr:M20/M25/M40 family metallo-hydrolase [Acidobacteriota bacterium]